MAQLGASGDLAGALDLVGDSPLALTVRLVVAAVLVAGGLSKLRSPGAASDAMVQFGVIRTSSASAGLALGAVELAVGIGLLAGRDSRLTAVPAVLLFGAFAVLIARAVRHGQRFSCGCLSSREDPIGPHTLVRALALLLVAVVAAAAPVEAALDAGAALNAAVVAGAAMGIWALAGAYLRAGPAWRTFVETKMDWELAIELNRDMVGEHR